MKAHSITFDVDWAPDHVIDQVAETVLRFGLSATWFVTHSSPAVERLKRHPDAFELGIHPNFLPGSTHGSTYSEVLNHCVRLLPDAVSMRSHAVFQNGRLLSEIANSTRIRIECSTFLPEMPNVVPLKQHCSSRELLRVPFFWSDDYELGKPNTSWDVERLWSINGLQVYLFHPIHVFLNTTSMEHYETAKKNVRDAESAYQQIENEKKGVAFAFLSLCEHLASHNVKTLLMRDLL